MKIDRRRKYIIVLDVETTNNNMESKHNDGLVYDIGFVICDKDGNIYAKRSFAIQEIFDWKELMSTAYYKEKLPKYYEKIAKGEMEKISIWKARKEYTKL